MTPEIGLVASWLIGQTNLADPRLTIAGVVLALAGGVVTGWYASKFSEKATRQAQEAYEGEVIRAAGHARARAKKEKEALEELVARVQEEHSQCGPRIAEIEKQLRDRTAAVGGLEANLEAEQQKHGADQSGVSQLKRRIRELEAQVNEAREQIEQARNEAGQEQEEEEHAAKETGPEELLTAVDGTQDDLQAIRGLGPILEQRLNELGIRQYRQLAKITPDNAEWVATKISILPGRIFFF